MDSDLRSNSRLNITLDTEAVVVRRVKTFIESGVEAADGRLPCERDLTKMIGVSRRKLRRALEVLEADGLIWRRQGKGTHKTGDLLENLETVRAALCG